MRPLILLFIFLSVTAIAELEASFATAQLRAVRINGSILLRHGQKKEPGTYCKATETILETPRSSIVTP